MTTDPINVMIGGMFGVVAIVSLVASMVLICKGIKEG